MRLKYNKHHHCLSFELTNRSLWSRYAHRCGVGSKRCSNPQCLAAKGKTIAVVALGLDIIHPKENKSLQKLILKNDGLLLSEQVIGVKANPTRSIARNRLQAALSGKVIVAQCTVRSGIMHTVRFATKYHNLNDKPHYHIFGHVHALSNQIYRRTCTTFCNISCLNDLEIELEK